MKRLLGLWAVAGCVNGPGEIAIEMPADFDRFIDEVQPELSASCSNPGCHGSVERPLELYAVHQHRLDPDDVYLDDPLTDAELWLNFMRVCGFAIDLDEVEDCEVLRKPLAPEAGGSEHMGGVQFSDVDNPSYEIIFDWLAAGVRASGVRDSGPTEEL